MSCRVTRDDLEIVWAAPYLEGSSRPRVIVCMDASRTRTRSARHRSMSERSDVRARIGIGEVAARLATSDGLTRGGVSRSNAGHVCRMEAPNLRSSLMTPLRVTRSNVSQPSRHSCIHTGGSLLSNHPFWPLESPTRIADPHLVSTDVRTRNRNTPGVVTGSHVRRIAERSSSSDASKDFGDRTEAARRDYEKFLDDLSKHPESAETMTSDEFRNSLRDDSEDKPTY